METVEVTEMPLQPEPWVYRPGDWDHEELHAAYTHQSIPVCTPPDAITVNLLGLKGETNPLQTLEADHENNTFRLSNFAPIHFINIRYITTNCGALCQNHVADHRFVIMVSTRQWDSVEKPEDCVIFNIFVQPESAEQALFILNFLQYHVFQHLKKETKEGDPSTLQQFIRPQLVQEYDAQVHWRKQRKTWMEKRIVMMDQECIILYRKSFEDAHEPRDQMFFWAEQFPKTVAKVSLIKSASCVLLHSLHMYVTLEYNEDTGPQIEAACQLIHHMPRKAFEDPQILLYWLGGRYHDITGEILPPPPKTAPVELDEEQAAKLDQLERELNEGLFIDPITYNQSQVMWSNIRARMERKARSQDLPTAPDWDLDPNCVDSLLEIISDIEKELFIKDRYFRALSKTIALKKIFESTGVERLRVLLADNEVDLLHKIFIKGNMFYKKSVVTSESFQDDTQTDTEDSDTEEEEEED